VKAFNTTFAGTLVEGGLLVIVVVLAITVIASLLKSRRDPEARAHAGSLRDTRNEHGQPRS
jgi:tellurite resistance protein TerC